jgi:(2R)-ethylmalonyl-CoA mutase
MTDVPVVVGGIIPDADAAELRRRGVAGVYTPKSYRLSAIMSEVIDLIAKMRA